MLFSPDGSHVAVAFDNSKTVSYWDLATARQIGTFEGHKTSVSALAFHPAGRTLAAVAHDDRTVISWDVATGIEQDVFRLHSFCHAIAFSPDGMTLAYGSDNDIELREAQTNRVKGILRGHGIRGTSVMKLVFSPDGRTLASTHFAEVSLRLWDVGAAKERYLESPDWWWDDCDPYIESIAFSSDGNTLATTSSYSVGVWDVKSGRSIARLRPGRSDTELTVPYMPGLRTVLNTSRELNAVQFAADGRLFVYGKQSDRLKRWTLTQTKQFTRQEKQFPIRSGGF